MNASFADQAAIAHVPRLAHSVGLWNADVDELYWFPVSHVCQEGFYKSDAVRAAFPS